MLSKLLSLLSTAKGAAAATANSDHEAKLWNVTDLAVQFVLSRMTLP